MIKMKHACLFAHVFLGNFFVGIALQRERHVGCVALRHGAT